MKSFKWFLSLIPVLLLTGCFHEHTFSTEITDPTCAKPGLSHTFGECGEIIDEILPPTGEHTWDEGICVREASCTEPAEWLYSCTVCPETSAETGTELAEHPWDEGIVTTEPACAEEGILTFTCTYCSLERTEIIPPTENHNWDAGQITTASTCLNEGEKTFTCTVCSGIRTEPVAKTNTHTWDSGTVTDAATCGDRGRSVYICTTCGKERIESIAATGKHSWDNGKVQTAATCGKDGTKIYTCTVCQNTKKVIVKATGLHSWNAGTVSVPAGEYTKGRIEYTCQVCSAGKSATIPSRAASTVFADPCNDKYFVSSYNPKHYVSVTLNGQQAVVKFRLDKEHMVKWGYSTDEYLNGEYKVSRSLVIDAWGNETLYLGDEEQFFDGREHSYTIPIKDPSKDLHIDISVHYSGQILDNGKTYTKYHSSSEGIFDSWYSDTGFYFKLKKSGSGYTFQYPSVYTHNLNTMTGIDPANCLGGWVADSVKKKAAEIVGSETDPYEKIHKLFKWVHYNIQYDYGRLYGYSSLPNYTAPADVLEHKYAVCEGFANLLCAMIRSQGIPAIVTSCYGQDDFGGKDLATVSGSNHVYTEAYVNGRWVLMDATWGYNTSSGTEYFDVSYPVWANSHKISWRNVQ